jgi:hypothetical protein
MYEIFSKTANTIMSSNGAYFFDYQLFKRIFTYIYPPKDNNPFEAHSIINE